MLKRDEIKLNRHRALGLCLSMIFSENRYALFPDHALASAKLRRDRVHGLGEIDIARGYSARIMR